jgi:ABC-type polysaccharide/polyol phosphate transport system ATPase subunit
MSDAVRARGLSKSFRLYPSYAQRALDALGLLAAGRRERIPQHVALRAVDLQIRRGEKVAIIGRNGAGKSTLLKLVTGVLKPSAGSVEVNGSVKALLEIGAGFHPELTGRQNVLGYLGHLGVTAAAAERALAEIVEFAEVEEYLEQPMKTYSAGMAMRLMFSTATQIAPDILVLDEVLSVGDAYFNQKSFGRIRDLCAARDATLLLVTHDIYAARSFCDRFVWIDAGTVRADGDPVSVVQEYEQSVRVQARAEQTRRLATAAERIQPESLVVEIGPPRNEHWPGPVWFRRIALYERDRLLGELVADAAGGDSAWLDGEGGWSGPITAHGAPARRLDPWVAPFQRAAVRIACAGGLGDSLRLRAIIEAWSPRACNLDVRLQGVQVPPRSAARPLPAGDWASLDVSEFLPVQPRDGAGRYRYGTGRAIVEGARFIDETGRPAQDFSVGGKMTVEIVARPLDPTLDERSTLVLAFHKEGIVEATRVVTEDLELGPPGTPKRIELTLEPLLLADGDYLVSVMLAEQRYFWRPAVYFTVSPHIHDFWARSFEVRVRGAHPAERGGIFRHPARWSIVPQAASAEEGEGS